jgi:hypothetical protein
VIPWAKYEVDLMFGTRDTCRVENILFNVVDLIFTQKADIGQIHDLHTYFLYEDDDVRPKWSHHHNRGLQDVHGQCHNQIIISLVYNDS